MWPFNKIKECIKENPKATLITACLGVGNLFITAGTTYFFAENALEFFGISSQGLLYFITGSAVYVSTFSQSFPGNYAHFARITDGRENQENASGGDAENNEENEIIPITGHAKVTQKALQGVAIAGFSYLLFNNYTSAASLLKALGLDYKKIKGGVIAISFVMASDKIITVKAYVWDGINKCIDTAVRDCCMGGAGQANNRIETTQLRKAVAIPIGILGSVSFGVIGGFITNNSLTIVGDMPAELRTTLSIVASILYMLLMMVTKGYSMGKNINNIGVEIKNKNKIVIFCHTVTGAVHVLYSGIATQAAATKVLKELLKINSGTALAQSLLAPVSISGAALEYFYTVRRTFENAPDQASTTPADPALLEDPEHSDHSMELEAVSEGQQNSPRPCNV